MFSIDLIEPYKVKAFSDAEYFGLGRLCWGIVRFMHIKYHQNIMSHNLHKIRCNTVRIPVAFVTS